MWAELPEDVYFELTDPRYITLSHGKKATYSDGCHGPLCTKAEREAKAQARQRAALASGKPYRVNRRSPEKLAYDEYLNRILAWHWLVRTAPNPTEMVLDGIRERQQIA